MKITAKQFIKKHEKSFTLEQFAKWGKKGGKAKSDAKTAACRRNGNQPKRKGEK